MKTMTRLVCGALLACMAGTMVGCDIDVDRDHGHAYYYDPYPYGHRYLYQRPVYVQPDRDHVRFEGHVDVR